MHMCIVTHTCVYIYIYIYIYTYTYIHTYIQGALPGGPRVQRRGAPHGLAEAEVRAGVVPLCLD